MGGELRHSWRGRSLMGISNVCARSAFMAASAFWKLCIVRRLERGQSDQAFQSWSEDLA